MKKYFMIIAFVMAFTLLLGAIGVFGGSSNTGTNVKPGTGTVTPDEPSEDNLEPLTVHLNDSGNCYVEDPTDLYVGYEFNFYLYSETRGLVGEQLACGTSTSFYFDEPCEDYYVVCKGYISEGGQLVAKGTSNTVFFA